jgi:hypothetical protein
MARDDEITSQICRNQLLGLLNTMTPFEQQRITAEIVAPIVELADLAEPVPVATDSVSSFSIRFAKATVAPPPVAPMPVPQPAAAAPVLQPAAARPAPSASATEQARLSSLAIVLTSFGVTLAIGALVMMAA